MEFWPIKKPTRLTLGIEWNVVDQAHGVLAFWALGSASVDTWLLGSVRFMVSLPWSAAQESVGKNNIGIWGDLGIEPRSQ